MDRLWGEFRAVSGGPPARAARRRAARSRRPNARGRLHAWPRVASRQLLRSRPRVMAYVGDTGGIRVVAGLHQGADAAAGHRPRSVGGEPAEDRGVAADRRWCSRTSAWSTTSPITCASSAVVLARRPRSCARRWRADGTDEERIRRFVEEMRADARRVLSPEDAAVDGSGRGLRSTVAGLARYWRKKAGVTHRTFEVVECRSVRSADSACDRHPRVGRLVATRSSADRRGSATRSPPAFRSTSGRRHAPDRRQDAAFAQAARDAFDVARRPFELDVDEAIERDGGGAVRRPRRRRPR